jgi:Lon protease-like protein
MTSPPPHFVLPLFPLGTVLYPGGLLPLRIFEVRYLDMIGKCHRAGTLSAWSG